VQGLGDQLREFVGREVFSQEVGEAVVCRRLGELPLESVSLQRGVGISFEQGPARKIAAQRENERQMLDRNRNVSMIWLARGMDTDRLARRRDGAQKIVYRCEIAREVVEQSGERVLIGTGPRRRKRLAVTFWRDGRRCAASL
jgi:hypothetical protein